MNELQDRVALITGGASGIGRAAVELFLEEGARVLIADLQDAAGAAMAAQHRPERCRYFHADVSHEADVRAMVDAAITSFGRLNVLFNNAGIEGEQAPDS